MVKHCNVVNPSTKLDIKTCRINFVLSRNLSRIIVFAISHTAVLCNKMHFITYGYINKLEHHVTFA
jgi:hypothetical protein